MKSIRLKWSVAKTSVGHWTKFWASLRQVVRPRGPVQFCFFTFHALTTVGTNASLDALSSSEIFDAVSQYQKWGYDLVITALFLTSPQTSYLHNIF